MDCDDFDCENAKPFFYENFPRYDEVVNYLKDLQKKHPSFVKVESIGTSYRGRDIYMIKLFKNSCPGKWAVLIDACTHAREWITLTSALYLIDSILRSPTLLYMFDFYIIPCLNPDGYEFSHIRKRLWRKNRNSNDEQDLRFQGVDLNRNFPCAFGSALVIHTQIAKLRNFVQAEAGSSCRKDSPLYRGECPLSEPEAKALSNVLSRYAHVIKLYVSLHAFGNCILYPWGFKYAAVYDEKELKKCAEKAKTAIYCCNKQLYTIGSVADKMYISSGNASDYAKKQFGIKFVYTIELRKGYNSGFTIGVESIPEVGAEVLAGVQAMSKHVYDYFLDIQRNCPLPPCKRRRICYK